MAQRVTGTEIETLIQLLAKLPGLGPRSARRAALHLIKKKDQLLHPLANAAAVAADKVSECSQCGNVDTIDPCTICNDPRRDHSTIVVVEDVSDLWALERAKAVNSLYHLRIDELVSRVTGERRPGPDGEPRQTELILAVNATVEGQTTAHYITDKLDELDVKITRLAHGVPVGGELDYLDEGTLTAAIKSRSDF